MARQSEEDRQTLRHHENIPNKTLNAELNGGYVSRHRWYLREKARRLLSNRERRVVVQVSASFGDQTTHHGFVVLSGYVNYMKTGNKYKERRSRSVGIWGNKSLADEDGALAETA